MASSNFVLAVAAMIGLLLILTVFTTKIDTGGSETNPISGMAAGGPKASTSSSVPEVSVAISDPNPTSSQSVTFTARATDNVRVKWVEIFVDGISVTRCNESGASATCSATRGPFVSGSHTYYATVTDTAKLTGKTPIKKFVTDTLPKVSVRHSPSKPTSADAVEFTATASDDSGVKYVEIVFNGSTLKKCEASGVSGNCSVTVGPYPAGTYAYYATATDIRDQVVQSSNVLTVSSVATLLPEVSVTHSPSSPASSDSVTYTATATDDVGLASIQIFVDGTSIRSCSVSGTSATCTKTAGPYAAGSTHNYYAKATDTSSQTKSSTSISFSVSGPEPVPQPSVTGEIVAASSAYPQVWMSDTDALQTFFVNASRPVVAEYATPSSVLIEKKIDSITVQLLKVGSPTGTVQIGVFDSSGNIAKLFGTSFDASVLTTSAQDITKTLASSDVYTIKSGDRIGVKFNGGNYLNYVAVKRDNNAAGPFDGVKTHLTFCGLLPCTFWTVSSPNTDYDLYMVLQEIDPAPASGAKPQFASGSPSHSPPNPNTGDAVTLSATATDDIGVTSIKIYTGNPPGTLVKTCTISPAATNPPACTQTVGPYSTTGTRKYYAIAYESPTSSTTSATKSFAVGSSSGDNIPYSSLVGANYRHPNLVGREGTGSTNVNTAHIDNHIAASKNMGINLWRVVVNWESYVGNEAGFLSTLDEVVKRANNNGIYVWIDFHHYFESSQVYQGGSGFPKFIVANYIPASKYTRSEYEAWNSLAANFWDDYYSNSINANGKSVWDHQSDFMRAMVNKVDKYPNVIGYEILNEPHVWSSDNSHYVAIGNLNTYIGNKLRNAEGSYPGTDRNIIFTRETLHGTGKLQKAERYRMAPRLTRLPDSVWWTPHHYAKTMDNFGGIDGYQATWDKIKSVYRITMPPMAAGEMSTQSNQYCIDPVTGKDTYDASDPSSCPDLLTEPAGQNNMDNAVGNLKQWMPKPVIPVYWQMGGGGEGGNQLTNPSTGALTVFGQRYKNSIAKYYPS